MRNKKRRLAMMQQREAEFKAHQDAMRSLAEEKSRAAAAEAKAKAEADAKIKAAAAAKAKAASEAAARAVAAKKEEETVHSHDLAAPEASKPSAKKSKSRTKKASK